MRSPAVRVALAMLAVLFTGVAILVYRGAQNREDQPVRFGVLADRAIGRVPPGRLACQAPVSLDRPVARIGLAVDTAGRPGPPLVVTVRDLRTRQVLRTARVAGGYAVPLHGFVTVPLDRPLRGDRSVAVCAENRGRRGLVVVGDNTADHSDATVGGKLLSADWAIFFPAEVDERRTLLGAAPDMVRRAAVMRPNIVTPLLFVVLAGLLLIGAPIVLWRAVSVAADADERLTGSPADDSGRRDSARTDPDVAPADDEGPDAGVS